MKSLNSFLNPKRKENLRFVLSNAFLGEDGKPIEWEMRQLTAPEGAELTKSLDSKDYTKAMSAYVAEALVYPDLHNKELLSGLSEREGKPILKAVDALMCLVNDAELASLISHYVQHNELTTGISEKIEEVKN